MINHIIANIEAALTPVNILMAGLSSVTGALGVAVKQLFSRLIKAEDKIEKMQGKIDELTALEAEASAKVEIFQNCPKRHECPFAKSEQFQPLKNKPFEY